MFRNIYLMNNIALFPFKDIDFYDRSILEEQFKKAQETPGYAKSNLLNKLHRSIILKCNVNNLDEINLMLEKYYPFLVKKDINKNYQESEIEGKLYDAYFNIINNFSQSLISHRHGEIVYKYWENEKDDEFLGPYSEIEKVNIFNSISKLISMDLITASYYSRNRMDIEQLNGFYQQVNLADDSLDDVLKRGVSENHLHASSAFNFMDLWITVMNELENEGYFTTFKPSYYNNYNKFENYIFTAQVLRIVLALFLSEWDSTTKNHTGEYFCIYEWIYNKYKANGGLSSDEYIMNENKDIYINLRKIFNFEDGEFLETSELKKIIESLRKLLPEEVENNKDIVMTILKEYSGIRTYSENILLNLCFKYKNVIKNSGNNQVHYNQFCNIFFKYISIKNFYYQEVTQSSRLKGLDFFQPYYSRAVGAFNIRSKNYYKDMLRALFQDSYLKKVELRISILDRAEDNKENIRRILTSYKEILQEDYYIKNGEYRDFPRIGIIYHLIKKPDNGNKCFCIYDRSSSINMDYLHFNKLQGEYHRLIDNFIQLRLKTPYLSNFIVGLDAASLENNTPVQVFAPIYNRARDGKIDPLTIKDGPGACWAKNQSLYFTFHAGEDFRHINSGLRRIDEAIDFCKFHSGDRIGHGIALGINIEKWCKANPVVIIPRGEYLDNLIWIWSVYSKNLHLDSTSYIYLEQKIIDIAVDIFNKESGLTVSLLSKVYKKRFEEIDIKENQVCIRSEQEIMKSWTEDSLYKAYHCKVYLEKLLEPIYINTSNIEEKMSLEMQKYLIEKIARSGIVIEVNPSSNFAIGYTNGVYYNHIFELNKVMDNTHNNLLVNVNSDNPLLFNTNVSNELAYLYYGMLKRSYGKEQSLTWIEKIRKLGMDTSFIKSESTNSEYLISLEKVLEYL